MGRSGQAARSRTTPPLRTVDVDQRIAQLHVEDGLVPAAIARRLTAEGVPAPRGVSWSQVTVERRLKRAGVFGSRLAQSSVAASRAVELRLESRSFAEIADRLAEEGIIGLHGPYTSHGVQKLIGRAAARGDRQAQEARTLQVPAPDRSPVGRPRVVTPAEARRIADDYLRTERNAALLAAWYTEEGRPAPHGGTVWYTATITDILRSVDVELLPPGWIPDEALELIRRRKLEAVGHRLDEDGSRRKVNEEIVAELNDRHIVANRHGNRWNMGRLHRAIKRMRLSAPGERSSSDDLERDESR